MRQKSAVQEVLVLGAGPAGIGAGLALGPRALVLEQAQHAGGLSCTMEWHGAVFDIGGHSFHTPHPRVRALVESAVELYSQKRDARCYSHGSLIPYPFQKNFRQLSDPQVVQQCAAGLEEAAEPGAANFLQFLQRRFGSGIAEHFMLPYNRKLWGPRLEQMAADWVGERVAAPEGVAESFQQQGGKRKPLQTGTEVSYPAEGGFGSIMTSLASRLANVAYGQRVVRVEPKARTVQTATGETYGFNRLVSTLPLPVLIAQCEGVPPEIEAAVAQLQVLSLKVALLVVDGPVNTEIQRIYCADATVPAHKIAFNHNSSDSLRRLPRHGIMAEISCANADKHSDAELIEWTVSGMQRMNALGPSDSILASKVVSVQHGYPVPSLARDSIVRQVKSWLAQHQIETLGRFGEWAYINSDEALHRGLALSHGN